MLPLSIVLFLPSFIEFGSLEIDRGHPPSQHEYTTQHTPPSIGLKVLAKRAARIVKIEQTSIATIVQKNNTNIESNCKSRSFRISVKLYRCSSKTILSCRKLFMCTVSSWIDPHGFYFFRESFFCGLYSRAAYIQENTVLKDIRVGCED